MLTNKKDDEDQAFAATLPGSVSRKNACFSGAGTATAASGTVRWKMVRIEDDIKLDYKDVLIRPKRSTLRSRSQVSLEREFNFCSSKHTWTGVPIMLANMDTGTCAEGSNQATTITDRFFRNTMRHAS